MYSSGGTEILALTALCISALSLAWNVFNTFFRLPRIHVVAAKHVSIYVGQVESVTYNPRISVINTGGEATTVMDVGLLGEQGDILLSLARVQEESGESVGEELPARIEAHGTLTWSIPDHLLDEAKKRERVYGFAARYRPLHMWSSRKRSHYRMHKARAPLQMPALQ